MELTVTCKMAPSEEAARLLVDTARTFAEACIYSAKEAIRLGIKNKLKLQYAVYKTVREKFGLSANLTIQAIRRACAAVSNKKAKPPKMFRPTSVSYDARTFEYRELEEQVSLTTIGRRIRVPLVLGKRQREMLKGKKPTSATVVRKNKDWFIHIVIDEEEPKKKGGGTPLGVDLGVRNIATMSTGKQISGVKVQAIKERYARARASLQSKGTRGAKRVLKRLSGRERRFISWTNHNVSKSIVQEAIAHKRGVIRFENLKGIRERTRSWSKHKNRMLSGWSFGELQKFTAYKATRAGLETEFVTPAWTSEIHHGCGKRGIRSFLKYWLYCPTCDRIEDADKNASKNIEAGGVEPGEIPGDRNAARIVEFFAHSKTQAKAAGL
jgi:IS605 OrfB family transposase